MDPAAVRLAYDAQIRRNPSSSRACDVVERGDAVVRLMSADGWTGVTWSDLQPATADAVIAAQVDRFARQGGPWEWKHYNDDRPADLAERLTAAGLVPGAVETLMVAEIADLGLVASLPAGVDLVPVVDDFGIAAVVRVHDEVFGGDHAAIGRELAVARMQDVPSVVAVIAAHEGTAVAAGRLELGWGTDFASLWGGGTLPAWRGRGIFRSLVADRAALAAAHGFRYLQVDASADSRPILRRLGFVELAMTTPFEHAG